MDRTTSTRLLGTVGVEFPACSAGSPPATGAARGAGRIGRPRNASPFLQPCASAGDGAWEVELRLAVAVGQVREASASPESGLVVRAVVPGTAPGAVRLRLGATAARPGWWPVEVRGTLGRCEAYIKVNGRQRGRDTEP